MSASGPLVTISKDPFQVWLFQFVANTHAKFHLKWRKFNVITSRICLYLSEEDQENFVRWACLTTFFYHRFSHRGSYLQDCLELPIASRERSRSNWTSLEKQLDPFGQRGPIASRGASVQYSKETYNHLWFSRSLCPPPPLWVRPCQKSGKLITYRLVTCTNLTEHIFGNYVLSTQITVYSLPLMKSVAFILMGLMLNWLINILSLFQFEGNFTW